MFRRKREPSRIPNYILLILLTLFAIVPVALLALNSLRTTQEIGAESLCPARSPGSSATTSKPGSKAASTRRWSTR